MPFLKPASSQCGNGELWWDGPRWVAVGCGLGRRQRRRTSRGIRRRSFFKHLVPIIIGCSWGCLEELLLSLGFISHQILQTLHLATANWMLLGSSGASVVFMTSHLILQTHGVPACLFVSLKLLSKKIACYGYFPSFLTFLANPICFEMNFNATVLVFKFVAIYI